MEVKSNLLVDFLLGLALVVSQIALSLLRPISSDRVNDRIRLAADAVNCCLRVTLRLCGLVFRLILSVFLFSRLLP